MQGVKITGKAGGTKPGFWMDGGIHAREWIAPATVLYMMTQLLELYGTDADITALVDAYDIYVLPVFNVDGYAYTWTNNRMWRKTRSPSPGSSCIGADPNRNFAFHWGEIGASADPCDETYRGAAPFSEIEAKQVADFIQGNGDIVAYFNIHSYSQLWLIPWGYTDAQTRDYALQMDLSKKATDALTMVHGTRYVYGPTYYTVYPTSGGSRDWTYGALNMVHSYGIELRDTGEYGFLLPADQIVPTGEETFAAMRVAMQYILAA